MNDPWIWTTVEIDEGNEGGMGGRGKNWDNYNRKTIKIFKK